MDRPGLWTPYPQEVSNVKTTSRSGNKFLGKVFLVGTSGVVLGATNMHTGDYVDAIGPTLSTPPLN